MEIMKIFSSSPALPRRPLAQFGYFRPETSLLHPFLPERDLHPPNCGVADARRKAPGTHGTMKLPSKYKQSKKTRIHKLLSYPHPIQSSSVEFFRHRPNLPFQRAPHFGHE